MSKVGDMFIFSRVVVKLVRVSTWRRKLCQYARKVNCCKFVWKCHPPDSLKDPVKSEKSSSAKSESSSLLKPGLKKLPDLGGKDLDHVVNLSPDTKNGKEKRYPVREGGWFFVPKETVCFFLELFAAILCRRACKACRVSRLERLVWFSALDIVSQYSNLISKCKECRVFLSQFWLSPI